MRFGNLQLPPAIVINQLMVSFLSLIPIHQQTKNFNCLVSSLATSDLDDLPQHAGRFNIEEAEYDVDNAEEDDIEGVEEEEDDADGSAEKEWSHENILLFLT